MRQINKTIFIVCEGEGTEPNYFESIRDLIIAQDLDVKITISPLPKNEEEPFQLRPNAKRRKLRDISFEKEAGLKKYEIEEEYRAQPIRYVREAQMGLEDDTFDEVWAVFDKNGHPNHKEAFELAEINVNNKKVNIAFSSIAFEYWIILHYEQLVYAFSKSQCREGKKVLNCGTNVHSNDCKGSLCICGYLKHHEFIPDYSKGMFNLFKILENNLDTAINNAAWLRNTVLTDNKEKLIYELNPYTNLDHLIFSLLQLPKDLTWFNNYEQISTNIIFQIKKEQDILRILIKNNNVGQRFILKEGSFSLADSSGKLHPFGGKHVLDQEEILIELDLKTLLDFNPIFVLYELTSEKYFITDLL